MTDDDHADDQELILEFVSEGRDMLDDAEQRLLDLHKGSVDGRTDVESVNAVFRQFHSIKGSAGFFGFNQVTKVTHEAETLLDMFRKGRLECRREHVDLLCRTCDMLRQLMDGIVADGRDTGFDEQAAVVVQELRRAMNNSAESPPVPAPPAGVCPPAAPPAVEAPPLPVAGLVTPDMVKLFVQDSAELLEDAEQTLLKLEKSPPDTDDLVNEVFRITHTFKGNSGFLGFADMQNLSHRMETALDLVRERTIPLNETNLQIFLNLVDILQGAVARLASDGDSAIQGCEVMLQILDEMAPAGSAAPPSAVSAAPEPPASVPVPPTPCERPSAEQAPPKSPRPAAAAAASVARQNIRVDVDKLDLLNNLIGELVIAESMVTNNSDLDGLRLENFERSSHHLHSITAALQNIAMSLRMVPLATTLRKMTRLVHDLAGKSGKKMELRLVGEETEVDKTVAELIADPLVHLVRNSADHGLEDAAARRAAGKSEVGEITIAARHQSGEVWIEVSDDGRGLNRDKILAKGIERGLVRSGEGLVDNDIFMLVFEPGFSTADAVTDVSGRGVGMDVVKKNLDKMRGQVVVNTTPGRGTTFTLRIPLTLAIIQGMLLRVADERYVLPMLTIRESFRPPAEILHTVTGKGEMVGIRGELLPMFRLSRLFRVERAVVDATQAIVVVVEDGRNRLALLVDELLGQQEVVIKSLGDVMGNVPGVSGASILPDGRVGLILDVRGLVAMATGK